MNFKFINNSNNDNNTIPNRPMSPAKGHERNTVPLPLLVLEQVCLRTGAGWSAFRSVSRFTGVSLTGVAGSEALLPGSLAGSGGDSMSDFRLTAELRRSLRTNSIRSVSSGTASCYLI